MYLVVNESGILFFVLLYTKYLKKEEEEKQEQEQEQEEQEEDDDDDEGAYVCETNRPLSLCFASSAIFFDQRTLLQLILKQTKNKQAKKLFLVFLSFCVINKQPEIQAGRKEIGFSFYQNTMTLKICTY